MKSKDDIVNFQMRKVKRGYRDAYLAGYEKPYKSIDFEDKYSAAFEQGQYASRRDTCMEGTF